MPKRIDRDEYINRLLTIHQNKYNYTLLPQTLSTKTRINVICDAHGVFTPTLGAHLDGTGCPQCNWDSKKSKTQAKLIAKAKVVHGDTYDYSKVTYTDKSVPVTIICKKHGEFSMRLWSHAYGPDKCPLCGSGKQRTTQDFITLAKEVHGERYDYSQAVYVGAKSKVDIICRTHGVFTQTPDSHCLTHKQGCPSCKASTGERAIYKALRDMRITDFVCEKQFDGLQAPDTNVPLRFDFYLPSYNTLIEFDGHAHFNCVNFSGTMSAHDMLANLERTQYLDNVKNMFAASHGYKLIRIHYTDIHNIDRILHSQLM